MHNKDSLQISRHKDSLKPASKRYQNQSPHRLFQRIQPRRSDDRLRDLGDSFRRVDDGLAYMATAITTHWLERPMLGLFPRKVAYC
jgi:hypothetical protein